ncbi:glyceraldehyde 3-phosphate dehydrogenase [Desulfosalsimonas propionicica]|uniref:Glyceraldehyde-3-phosphate dehydrogenase n=1 Tax=Desulfosalsimonas propionicica TaxID=332175 RepID=A0A7W0C797_9BACT|nr:type I glyceraldehyde-3-phosphate dehydrogenase [Desulfosalsimonas propionicica]MBA2880402.1 glyceraldehyde 3-phosphate dehydrogenase [Desulfosalsimonas propionicica]
MAIKLGINGMGRIGRLVFRAALKRSDIEVTAVNDIMDTKSLAHLLIYDSVHPRLDAEIIARDNAISVNGKTIRVFAEKDPANIGWKEAGVDIVAECTGLFRDRDSAAKHLSAGAKKVIISAPGKDPDMTFVMGVNETDYDSANHHIVSNASCTTNCLAPVAKVLDEKFGIQSGLMTTVHSYTSDQRLLDAPHKDLRRARAAAMSMIPTTTGAAKAVGLVLPQLNGKLNGMAIRVPTPNVSLVDFVATLRQPASAETVNAALKEAAEGPLAGILGFSELPLVSEDFNGNSLSSVVDAENTYVIDNMVKVLSWYDNETGYSTRLVDLAEMMGKQL